MVIEVTLIEGDDSELVKINDRLWNTLRLGEGMTTVALSQSKGASRTARQQPLICWAISSSEVVGVAIPKHLTTPQGGFLQYGGEGPGTQSISITPVTPVPLEEVVLMASSRLAYTAAQNAPEQLRAQLAETRAILRQGSTLSVTPSSAVGKGRVGNDAAEHKLGYKIILTTPVHQGYVDLEKTQVVVAAGDFNPEEEFVSSPVSSANMAASESDEEGSDIDESFLLNSLSEPNGAKKGPQEHMIGAVNSTSFKVIPLESRHRLPTDEFRDLTILVRTADLARLGIFSGDWVVISNPEDRPKSRLVRVLGTDAHDTLLLGNLLAPPLLLNNMSLNNSVLLYACIQQSPFGPQTPPIPTARSITLARIASPISVQKKYQPLVLWALRRHLHESKQLLKEGDIVAIPLSSSLGTLLEGISEKEGKQGPSIGELVEQFQATETESDEIAFFRVTHIEHDLVQIKGDATPDTHFAAVMGELGCWVNPETTRLTQSGLENSRVPDLDTFLGISRKDPLLSTEGRISMIASSDSPFLQIRDVLAATLHPAASDYKLAVTVLVTGNAGVGKRTMVRWASKELGLHVMEVDCFDVVDDTEVKTEGILKARFEQAEEVAPSVLLLRNIDSLARKSQKMETGKEPAIASILKDCIANLEVARSRNGFPTILVATVRDVDAVPLGILTCFKHQISIGAPDEMQRLVILKGLLRDSATGIDVSLENVATQTAALVAGDLANLVSLAHIAASERILELRLNIPPENAKFAGYSMMAVDFERALGQARASFSESIGAPSIPKVSWDDVGGLVSVKADILDTIQLPLQHPEVFSDGMKKRSGVLLFGPPGTGKTLLAKAVATSFSLNFFSVKGPELLNMYIGESEANVRRVFQRARDARPCVIFFDELDSVAPKRGNQGDSGGVMDRIVSQLLAELDGMSDGSGADVFVIGATNRPDLLDPALLRPGRFDKLLYLGVSETHESQLKIIEALTRKFHLDADLDLREIAEQCSFNYTGADFYALCSDAMLKAMMRKASLVDKKIATLNSQPRDPAHVYPITPQYYLGEMATEDDTNIIVSREDFLAALQELVPSVSQTEMEHYRLVQQKFAENTKQPDDQEESRDDLPLLEDGADVDLASVKVDRKGKGRAV